jgi:hypothetical protein
MSIGGQELYTEGATALFERISAAISAWEISGEWLFENVLPRGVWWRYLLHTFHDLVSDTCVNLDQQMLLRWLMISGSECHSILTQRRIQVSFPSGNVPEGQISVRTISHTFMPAFRGQTIA